MGISRIRRLFRRKRKSNTTRLSVARDDHRAVHASANDPDGQTILGKPGFGSDGYNGGERRPRNLGALNGPMLANGPRAGWLIAKLRPPRFRKCKRKSKAVMIILVRGMER